MACTDIKSNKDLKLEDEYPELNQVTPPITQNFDLPIKSDAKTLPQLESFRNKNLTDLLVAEINKSPKYKSLLNSKKMSIGLVDLETPFSPSYATINGDHMMYAASLPKIAVLLAVQDAIYKNELEETGSVRDDMRLMISKSNNAATTRLIDLVGFDKIEQTLRGDRYQFYDETRGGGLWVGKRYAKRGETNREPLKNLSHAATSHQVCRFYYQLVFGQLVSFERSADMLQIMTNPGLKHKFVYSLEKIAPEAALYRKSGSWKNWHSDSVLVWDDDRKYILVALIEDSEGEALIRNLVSPIEKVLSQF